MTQQEITRGLNDSAINSELLDLLESEPINWIPLNCSIINKQGNLERLEPNRAQIKLQMIIDNLVEQGKPVRIIILKARQQGMTTWGAALQFCHTNLKPNKNALISAHDDESSIEIFRKIRLYQEEAYEPLDTDYSSRKEIVYASPHRSSLLVKTAGKENLGRGTTIHYFHASEVAFWPRAKKTLLSVMQCIPRNNPDTMVLLESTANGMGGEFYQRWKDAVAGNSDFVPVFLPWFEFPEYRAPVNIQKFIYTPEEKELAKAYGLSQGQLQWRRETIRNECGGDEDLFKQEYPSNPEEAFLVSGRPYFPAGQLAYLEHRTSDPYYTGMMTEDGLDQDLEPKECWEVIELPVEGKLYAVGADVAEGLDRTETNNPDKTDRSICHVMDVVNKRIVAKLRCRMHEDIFAEQCVLAAKWYNNAKLGWDPNNKCGGAFTASVKSLLYDNLYYAKKYDKVSDTYTEKVGFGLDKVTRPMCLSDLRSLIRGSSGPPLIEIFSRETVRELQTFMIDKDGKPQALEGEYDDEVLALAIVLQVGISSYGDESVLDEYYDHVNSYEHRICQPGAVDDFSDLEDDDY
jgi:hypothetical protein